MITRRTLLGSAALLTAGAALPGASKVWAQPKKFEIVMCAKQEGISWFDDMRTGVEDFAKDFGVNAYQIAPETGDPAKQAQMVESLIAKNVDAILVVPNDPKSMEPVLQKAKDAGIVIVSHEAKSLAGTADYDVEAFKNEDFGALMFDKLAKAMNGEGKFVAIVGALTMETHMQWFNAGMEHIKADYPDMEFVLSEPIEDNNDEKTALDKVNEVLKRYPDLKGIVGCSVSGTSMAALAVEKLRRKDIAVVGLGLPSINGPYLEDGYQNVALCWRPADAGYASAFVAYKLLNGETVEAGMDLKRPGYDSVTIEDGVVYGDATLILTAENWKNYKF
ncbi:simple sugar transport system substrate-binding protein [Rhodopseudomonas julia]|uniref:Simple sugar transport system substrate-binding protein n=1 Tax=Rhodopseudomonas julia TaxID=200617 RepID=A0ABU0C8U0_9BRAD|nr:autoinducer 2 ABC transporter substrate-binding protein [Rhodopseudomonas julia]MDQ0326955.1 simple sugar transport system substrate-binding protein [Rhodopseudomonas julia]